MKTYRGSRIIEQSWKDKTYWEHSQLPSSRRITIMMVCQWTRERDLCINVTQADSNQSADFNDVSGQLTTVQFWFMKIINVKWDQYHFNWTCNIEVSIWECISFRYFTKAWNSVEMRLTIVKGSAFWIIWVKSFSASLGLTHASVLTLKVVDLTI